jgi:hypothetical protein
MSFLLVKGRTLNCEACGGRWSYDYTGGAQMTQVSDPVIFEQERMRKKYKQPGKLPSLTGWYLQSIGICEECAGKKFGLADDFGRANRYSQVMEKISELTSSVEEEATLRQAALGAQIFAGYDLDRFKSLSPNAWADTIGAPGFDQRKPKRQRSAVKNFAKAVVPKLIPELSMVVNQDQKYQRIVARLQAIPTLVEEARKALKSTPKEFYRRVELGGPESLNPYIQTEDTVREPVPGQPPAAFWFKAGLDADEEKETLDELGSADWSTLDCSPDVLNPALLARLYFLLKLDGEPDIESEV